MNIRRYLVSTVERWQYTPFFKFKSTDVNLLFCLVCLSDKNGRFHVMIGQIACQSNSQRRVNWQSLIWSDSAVTGNCNHSFNWLVPANCSLLYRVTTAKQHCFYHAAIFVPDRSSVCVLAVGFYTDSFCSHSIFANSTVLF